MKHNTKKASLQQNENAVSRLQERRRLTGAPVIGVILMVAITVVLAAIVFILVQNLSEKPADRPTVAFTKQSPTSYMVASADTGLVWEDFTVTGCDTVPTGSLDAGDMLEACGTSVVVAHTPSNTVVWASA